VNEKRNLEGEGEGGIGGTGLFIQSPSAIRIAVSHAPKDFLVIIYLCVFGYRLEGFHALEGTHIR